MAKIIKITIDRKDYEDRLDRCLSRVIRDSSRSYLQKLIKNGAVTCDGVVVDLPKMMVKCGMTLQVELAEEVSDIPCAENFEFEILYEDDQMLVINKPPDVVVHPAVGNPSGTVVNALLSRYPELGEQLSVNNSRPGIVHRLDKDTSGCLIVAKTQTAQFKLAQSFASRVVHTHYLALVVGFPHQNEGRIETLIGRHPVNRQKMAVVERNGKNAISAYKVIGQGGIDNVPISLLEVEIFTGRTHQIRVHMAYLGFPVAGDKVYGGSRRLELPRQLLHAYRVSIPHPLSGEIMEFKAPVPADMAEIIAQLQLNSAVSKIIMGKNNQD